MAVSQEDTTRARGWIDEALALVGEGAFADLVEDVAADRLRTAVGRLQATVWWQRTLTDALVNPGTYNTTLLCKLLDKAVPTQQAVKVGAEEGFRLVIEQALPREEDTENG